MGKYNPREGGREGCVGGGRGVGPGTYILYDLARSAAKVGTFRASGDHPTLKEELPLEKV